MDPKRILIRAPNWIGDQIMAYPFFWFLRDQYPAAHIAVQCRPIVKSIQFKDLVDEIIEIPPHSSISAILKTSRELKKKGPWDLGILLPHSFSSALIFFLAKVKRRRGYKADFRNLLLNEGLTFDPDPNRHRSQAFSDELPFPPRLPSFEFFGPKFSATPLPGGNPFKTHARTLDPTTSFEGPFDRFPEKKYFVIGLGSNAPARKWSVRSFAELANLIFESSGAIPVLVGPKKDQRLADEFKEFFKHECDDRTGRSPITRHALLFRNAQFSLCNESGLAHFASLCGSKVFIICGAADPKRTQPIGPGEVSVSYNAIDCWPCEKNTCRLSEKNKCLNGILPENVFKKINLNFNQPFK